MAATSLLLVHCGSDSFDAAKDCQQICQKYEDCVDSDFDVSACANNCRDRADVDSAFDAKADACESCIDTNESCAESGAQCTAECAAVVSASN